jgi:hypothetical protein
MLFSRGAIRPVIGSCVLSFLVVFMFSCCSS